MDIPVSAVAWRPCFRIVSSRFAPIALFEKVADPEDLEAINQLEAMTNDRLRDEAGELSLVPPEDRVSGPGTSSIMAAFTHLNPVGDRFADGSYGVFYAGDTVETALAETRFLRARFMRATNEPAQELDMRVYAVDLAGDLHDIRAMRKSRAELYDLANYGASQSFAADLRAAGANGIVYQSMRLDGGECAAVFKPRLLGNCRQERHLCYVWSGSEIQVVYEKRAFGE